MKLKNVIAFVLAAAVCLAAAHYRFYDSSHSIGMMNDAGGKAIHPLILDAGKNLYSVIVTARVMPPYRGDARVVLEGTPPMTYTLYNSEPVIDLGVHRHPDFKNNSFYGLQAGDSIALWMVMKPEKPDSNFQSEKESDIKTAIPTGYSSECCSSVPPSNHAKEKNRAPGEGLALSFYDIHTNQPVMRIPVIFKTAGEDRHATEIQ